MTAFDSRRGTWWRLASLGRQVMVWSNAFMAGRIRPAARTCSASSILDRDHRTCRKSGVDVTAVRRLVPLLVHGNLMIVALANGATDNPAWAHNLAGGLDKARIEVDGTEILVTAQQPDGADATARLAWQSVTAAALASPSTRPRQTARSRVILLTPRASG